MVKKDVRETFESFLVKKYGLKNAVIRARPYGPWPIVFQIIMEEVGKKNLIQIVAKFKDQELMEIFISTFDKLNELDNESVDMLIFDSWKNRKPKINL